MRSLVAYALLSLLLAAHVSSQSVPAACQPLLSPQVQGGFPCLNPAAANSEFGFACLLAELTAVSSPALSWKLIFGSLATQLNFPAPTSATPQPSACLVGFLNYPTPLSASDQQLLGSLFGIVASLSATPGGQSQLAQVLGVVAQSVVNVASPQPGATLHSPFYYLNNAPDAIHLALVPNGVVVSWQTFFNYSKGPVVRYSTDSAFSSWRTKVATGTTKTYGTAYFHSVVLKNLQPDQQYFYQIAPYATSPFSWFGQAETTQAEVVAPLSGRLSQLRTLSLSHVTANLEEGAELTHFEKVLLHALDHHETRGKPFPRVQEHIEKLLKHEQGAVEAASHLQLKCWDSLNFTPVNSAIPPLDAASMTALLTYLQLSISFTLDSTTFFGFAIPAANTLQLLPFDFCGTVQNSAVLSFTSAPELDDDYDDSRRNPKQVVILGDMGTYNAGPTRDKLISVVPSTSLFIHIGDISYADNFYWRPLSPGDNTYESSWDSWQAWMQPITSKVPYMVLPGNHEAACQEALSSFLCPPQSRDFQAYRYRFRMPSIESGAGNVQSMWSSFDFGLIHFIMINTETDYLNSPEGTVGATTFSASFGGANGIPAQIAWLKDDLRRVNRDVTPWVVALGHRPAYTSAPASQGTGAAQVAAAFADIFTQYKVDAYFAGHIHNYERLYPIAGGNPVKAGVSAHVYQQPGAPIYIINGAAGNDEGHENDGVNTTISAFIDTSNFGFGTLTAYNDTHLLWKFLSANPAVTAPLDYLWVVKAKQHGDSGGGFWWNWFGGGVGGFCFFGAAGVFLIRRRRRRAASSSTQSSEGEVSVNQSSVSIQMTNEGGNDVAALTNVQRIYELTEAAGNSPSASVEGV